MEPMQLYIDHQLVAPLVRDLEDILQQCLAELNNKCPNRLIEDQSHEIRMSLYKEFLSLLCEAYDSQVKVKNEAYEESMEEEEKNGESAECDLAAWIRASGRQSFSKKEIDGKLQEFRGSKKQALSINKLIKVLRQNNVSGITITTRSGSSHPIEPLVKKYEQFPSESEYGMSPWIDFADFMEDETIKEEEVELERDNFEQKFQFHDEMIYEEDSF